MNIALWSPRGAQARERTRGAGATILLKICKFDLEFEVLDMVLNMHKSRIGSRCMLHKPQFFPFKNEK
jgi:hypothetical protein